VCGSIHGETEALRVIVGCGGRREVIEETAVLVIEDDQQRFVPLRAGGQRMVDGQHQFLAVLDVGRGVVVVGLEADGVEVAEVRVDPGNRRQRALGGVGQEARRVSVDPLDPAFPVQLGRAEEREPVMVAERITGIGEPQGAGGFEGVPAPRDAVGVQVPHK
jgi:hypothetical protein